jgi:TfoX/Sxy family transcriptional regulator of competence genes
VQSSTTSDDPTVEGKESIRGGTMPMVIPTASPATVKRFEELVPAIGGVTVKKMFGQPAAFLNGNLFFGVFGEKLFIRLSEQNCTEAKSTHRFTTFEPMPGRAMREYVVLPRTVLDDLTRSHGWVARSVEFASALPKKRAKSKGK